MIDLYMFEYNVQLAGYAYDRYDEMGHVDYNGFIQAFDAFPWLEQAEAREKMDDGCSATISVLSVRDKQDFWVSIAGDKNRHLFLVGIVYDKPKRGLFGLGKDKLVRWVDIFEVEDRDTVKSLFKLFFERKHAELQSAIGKLRKFDSMKAYIQ